MQDKKKVKNFVQYLKLRLKSSRCGISLLFLKNFLQHFFIFFSTFFEHAVETVEKLVAKLRFLH